MASLMADVSSWNPTSESFFRKLKDLGVVAVVVKLTEGTGYVNPQAAAQLKASQNVGLITHAYHFARFQTTSGAVAEGQFFLRRAKALGIPTERVMVADVEAPELPHELTGLTNTFLQVIKSGGYPHTDLYTMASFMWAKRFDRTQLMPKNLWIANYGVDRPGVDNVGTWQFTNNFQQLHVDMSYDFFGHYTSRLTHHLTTAPTVPAVRYHIVKPGESWWAIAARYHMNMTELARLNGKTILSVIHPGDHIRLN